MRALEVDKQLSFVELVMISEQAIGVRGQQHKRLFAWKGMLLWHNSHAGNLQGKPDTCQRNCVEPHAVCAAGLLATIFRNWP
jgi:hypothetical protein